MEAFQNHLSYDILSRLTRDISVNSPAQLEAKVLQCMQDCAQMLGADQAFLLRRTSARNHSLALAYLIDNEQQHLFQAGFGDLNLSHYRLWERILKNKRTFQIADATNIPDNYPLEKQLFLTCNIRAFLQVPVMYAGECSGFLAFCWSEPGIRWSKTQVALLKDAGELLGLVLEKIQTGKVGVPPPVVNLSKSNPSPSSIALQPDIDCIAPVLEGLDYGVAVYDRHSGQILFANEKFAQLLSFNKRNKITSDVVFRYFRENGYKITDFFSHSQPLQSREFSLHVAGKYISGSINPLASAPLLLINLHDITPITHYEKSERQLNRQLQILSETAIQLIQPLEEDIYQFIGNAAVSLFPGAIILVNSYNAPQGFLQTRFVSGFATPLDTIARMMGSHPLNKKYPLTPQSEVYKHIASNFVFEIQNGISELSLGAIPAPLARKIEQLLNVKKFYACGLFFNEKLYGSLTLMLRPDMVAHPFVMETFARMVSSAMRNREMSIELYEKELLFANLVRQSHDAIIIMSDDGKITEFNASAEALSGIKAHDAIGNLIWEIETRLQFRPDHLGVNVEYSMEKLKKGFLRLFDPVCDGNKNSRGFIVEAAGGKRRHVTVSNFVFHVGERRYVCRISTDTTAAFEKNEQEKLKEIQNRIDQAKSLFLDNMSHEMRTPLSGIIGMTDLLMRSGLNPTQQELLNVVKDSSDSLLKLIGNIHQLSVIDAKGVVLKNEVFTLDTLIEDTVNVFKAAAFQKNIELTFVLPDATAMQLRGDALRLQQVLTNLIANAVKFTPEGGSVWIEVTAQPCNLGAMCLEMKVGDTGIGIAPDQLQLLFKRFYQVDDSYTREHDGVGIGLAISKELIELMGGDIFVESEAGKGSVFTLRLSLPLA